MNVLFISPQPYPNGMASSKRIRLFAEYLAKTCKVKTLICGRSNGSNRANGTQSKVSWEHIKFTRFEYFLNLSKVIKLLKQNFSKDQKNIIFLYDGIGLTNILFAIVGRRMGYKIFTDIVEDYSVHLEKTSFWLSILHKVNVFFDRRIANYVDGIIVISSRLSSKYSDLGFSEKNMCLISISAENIGNEVADSSSENFSFVYSGSYGNKDGVDDLVEAMKKINQKHHNVELILSGKISDLINAKIQSEEYIKYVGLIPEDDYYNFLSRADVLLMTRVNSKYANTGFPFKLGEYLATGNLVIATDVSDVSTYLKDKHSALIAEPSNIASLYSKMEYAILNQNKGKEIGKKGRKVCKEYFNPETNGEAVLSFIKRLSNA